ncbi:cytochrome P450 [Longimycelium tulufanense]|uniref:Cytochrome P450 n=1 Tax=Longimycelium tulufanense TaxID=907463 RepID=A0A8J3FSB9_9PSEU|nr:cytochrome P450 [Longimycelium tulufanense]GGM36350.1 cytochrome P450 [Longimycelium tulufanense]
MTTEDTRVGGQPANAGTSRPVTRDFPLAPPGTMGPPREYAELQRGCPIARVRTPLGATAWYVTRYEDVRSLLADPRLIRPTINVWPPAESADSSGPGLVTMMEMVGPRHRALRRAVGEAFSARTVRSREGRIRQLAESILNDFEKDGPPADLVTGFAESFPLLVMCELVGIPYEERDFFLPLADAALGALLTLEEGRRATDRLRSYIAQLVARKQTEPARDLLGELLRQRDDGELTQDDLISFGLSMLVGGYRTSTMFIANAVLVLLTRMEHLAVLRSDPGLLPSAVEELLRFLPVMNGSVVLLAKEDIRLHGTTIRAGDAVLPIIPAANRDATVFPDPDRLDLRRERNPHLAFGRGAHNCVGIHLARVELTVALEALLDRFPNLRLAVAEHEVPWEDDSPSKSPVSLPVSW